MFIPKYVSDVINLLEHNGFAAYVVGGSVRDNLLGRETHDFDIASLALPEETLEIFHEYKTVTNGMKHGTVTVISDGKPVEVTTFRSDGTYSDTRRPDSVSFVRSIEEDLARRDFTVNAMAYREGEGIIDPYGGQEDLKNKTIRCVGNPETRFSEDALRIMRGMRFASTLGFSIEEKTLSAMLKTKGLLMNIAAERISAELKGILLGDAVFDVLMLCREVIFEIIPELSSEGSYIMKKYPGMTLWEHTARSVSMTQENFSERLAMLLHDVAKPQCMVIADGKETYPNHAEVGADIVEGILKNLRYDKKTNSAVLKLIKNHSIRFPKTLEDMRRFVRDYGLGFTKEWLDIKYADVFSKAHKESTAQLYYDAVGFYREIVDRGLCCTVGELDISGKDLTQIGINGKKVGTVLEELLEAVITGRCENYKEALIQNAKRIKV